MAIQCLSIISAFGPFAIFGIHRQTDHIDHRPPTKLNIECTGRTFLGHDDVQPVDLPKKTNSLVEETFFTIVSCYDDVVLSIRWNLATSSTHGTNYR
jgi:hypothetical protein